MGLSSAVLICKEWIFESGRPLPSKTGTELQLVDKSLSLYYAMHTPNLVIYLKVIRGQMSNEVSQGGGSLE